MLDRTTELDCTGKIIDQRDRPVSRLLWLLSLDDLEELLELVDEQLSNTILNESEFYEPSGKGSRIFLQLVEEDHMRPESGRSFSKEAGWQQRYDRLLLDDE